MKLSRLLLPALGALAFLAAPTTSHADRRITVYRDGDGDGHFNRKRIEVRDRHFYRGARFSDCGPVGWRQPFPFFRTGPWLGVSYVRTYRPAFTTAGCSDDLAVEVQRELRRRGYYHGLIDGDVGPGTRYAIRAYQYDRGLAVTGRIDRSLLRALGIG